MNTSEIAERILLRILRIGGVYEVGVTLEVIDIAHVAVLHAVDEEHHDARVGHMVANPRQELPIVEVGIGVEEEEHVLCAIGLKVLRIEDVLIPQVFEGQTEESVGDTAVVYLIEEVSDTVADAVVNVEEMDVVPPYHVPTHHLTGVEQTTEYEEV